jgi:hypothetical protein
MRELVDAGAPELPDGWFYRVADTRLIGLVVEIREQRKHFGSRELEHAYVHERNHDDAESAIVDACNRAYARLQGQVEARARFCALLPFLGDHDPKGGK